MQLYQIICTTRIWIVLHKEPLYPHPKDVQCGFLLYSPFFLVFHVFKPLDSWQWTSVENSLMVYWFIFLCPSLGSFFSWFLNYFIWYLSLLIVQHTLECYSVYFFGRHAFHCSPYLTFLFPSSKFLECMVLFNSWILYTTVVTHIF